MSVVSCECAVYFAGSAGRVEGSGRTIDPASHGAVAATKPPGPSIVTGTTGTTPPEPSPIDTGAGPTEGPAGGALIGVPTIVIGGIVPPEGSPGGGEKIGGSTGGASTGMGLTGPITGGATAGAFAALVSAPAAPGKEGIPGVAEAPWPAAPAGLFPLLSARPAMTAAATMGRIGNAIAPSFHSEQTTRILVVIVLAHHRNVKLRHSSEARSVLREDLQARERLFATRLELGNAPAREADTVRGPAGDHRGNVAPHVQGSVSFALKRHAARVEERRALEPREEPRDVEPNQAPELRPEDALLVEESDLIEIAVFECVNVLHDGSDLSPRKARLSKSAAGVCARGRDPGRHAAALIHLHLGPEEERGEGQSDRRVRVVRGERDGVALVGNAHLEIQRAGLGRREERAGNRGARGTARDLRDGPDRRDRERRRRSDRRGVDHQILPPEVHLGVDGDRRVAATGDRRGEDEADPPAGRSPALRVALVRHVRAPLRLRGGHSSLRFSPGAAARPKPSVTAAGIPRGGAAGSVTMPTRKADRLRRRRRSPRALRRARGSRETGPARGRFHALLRAARRSGMLRPARRERHL